MNGLQKKTCSRLIFIGVLALGLGIAVYALDRPAMQTYFIPNNLNTYAGTESIFGPLGNHLPTFLHTFAFCVITAAVLGGGRRGALIVCLFWLIIDSLFEIAQHTDISNVIVPFIPDWFTNVPVLENAENYFSQGQFDPVDLISILLGVVCAYVLIRRSITSTSDTPTPSILN